MSRLARLAVIACLATWLGSTGMVHAHRASIAHSRVDISSDRTEATYHIDIPPVDLAEALGLLPDTEPADADIVAGTERLLDYVLARIEMTSSGTPCPITRLGARVVVKGSSRFAELGWRMRCSAAMAQLIIDYALFFDIDPLHRGLIQVRYGSERAITELELERSRFVWDLAEPPPATHWAFVSSGIEHVIYGFDHVAFVLALLLVVVIMRSPGAKQASQSGQAGHKGAWQPRPLGASLRATAGIVTTFTAAHSITLIAASLGWVSLNSRLVESIIALSIVYVAVDNIIRPTAQHRLKITFAFGLIHGLGFASMLRELLPPGDVLVPLLLFNVGVELGQLIVVVIMLPLLHWAARAIHADWYRERGMPGLAAFLAVAGLVWLIERLFEVSMLGL